MPYMKALTQFCSFAFGLFVAAFFISRCASVNAVPLRQGGTPPWSCFLGFGKAGGFRYYMPKPYLLITELPGVPTPPATSQQSGSALQAPAAKKGGGGG